ncbi:MAG: hypothetical protein C4560_10545 [Nitrospiraceae bacterium]|nr:MAG: hypothetical protein C4560_10545 [Nitrospiraceae bacterium]
MSDINSFAEKIGALISKFDKDKNHYLSKGYPEAQVRIDFLNPFFKALGWDIENKAQKPPHEREARTHISRFTRMRSPWSPVDYHEPVEAEGVGKIIGHDEDSLPLLVSCGCVFSVGLSDKETFKPQNADEVYFKGFLHVWAA